MHPVLHKIMPHTGTDFGAPMGAPIYSAYKGTVSSAGPLGPCGSKGPSEEAGVAAALLGEAIP